MSSTAPSAPSFYSNYHIVGALQKSDAQTDVSCIFDAPGGGVTPQVTRGNIPITSASSAEEQRQMRSESRNEIRAGVVRL